MKLVKISSVLKKQEIEPNDLTDWVIEEEVGNVVNNERYSVGGNSDEDKKGSGAKRPTPPEDTPIFFR
ncbi:MAG: hypothetical protein UZ19_OD1000753 [Parcubacteria bacterium OLB19]|nr:MAG: hypothetical protein UZ19_OD1000753 [Parcubacteria bacterium OLB19]